MSDLRFACTQCGRCCHHHNLPLTLLEAIAWLEDGGEVQVFCEAAPWPAEPPPGDLRAAHRRRRSFAARSGQAPLRITVLLVGAIAGACRHLRDDMRCGIYARRPMVCRIYPAELNPFLSLEPSGKACPSEAWAQGAPLIAGGRLIDADTLALVERRRQADHDDAPCKQALCRLLGIEVTALADEGFAVYAPAREPLLAALRAARDLAPEQLAVPTQWRLITASIDSVVALHALGARFVDAPRPDDPFRLVTVIGKAGVAST